MPLLLVENPTFRRPVAVKWPHLSEPERFTAVFRVLTVDEARRAMAPLRELAGRPAPAEDDQAGTVAYLDAMDDARATVLAGVVCGWEEVVHASGAPVEFSPETLRRALGLPAIRQALWDAWTSPEGGAQDEVRSGNSAAPPAS